MSSLEIVNAHIEYFEKCKKAYTKASDIDTANEYKKDIETFNTIKQDLEAYGQLKQNHDITLINNGELVVKVADLQKENNELKKRLELEKFDWFIVLNNKLDRYKKALEILSNYICVRNPLDEEDSYYLSALFSNEEIDKQTHDLLKEVLEDE